MFNFGKKIFLFVFFINFFIFFIPSSAIKCAVGTDLKPTAEATDCAKTHATAVCCFLTLKDAGAEAEGACPEAGQGENANDCDGSCKHEGDKWLCKCSGEECNKAGSEAAVKCSKEICVTAMTEASKSGTTADPNPNKGGGDGGNGDSSDKNNKDNNHNSTAGSPTTQPIHSDGTTPPKAKPNPTKKGPNKTTPKAGNPNNQGTGAGFIPNADLKKVFAAFIAVIAVIAA